MNTMENNTELKNMMKGFRLEKPGAGFSSKVMDAIVAESATSSVYRTERILDNKFWIFTGLFIALGVAMVVLGNGETSAGGSVFSGLLERFPAPEWGVAKEGISRISDFFTGMPVMLFTVIASAFALILADKILGSRHKLHAG